MTPSNRLPSPALPEVANSVVTATGASPGIPPRSIPVKIALRYKRNA